MTQLYDWGYFMHFPQISGDTWLDDSKPLLINMFYHPFMYGIWYYVYHWTKSSGCWLLLGVYNICHCPCPFDVRLIVADTYPVDFGWYHTPQININKPGRFMNWAKIQKYKKHILGPIYPYIPILSHCVPIHWSLNHSDNFTGDP